MSSSRRQPLKLKYGENTENNSNGFEKNIVETLKLKKKNDSILEKEIFKPYISNKINNSVNTKISSYKNKNKNNVQVKDGKLSIEAENIRNDLFYLLNQRKNNKKLENIQRNYLIKKENERKYLKNKIKKKYEFKTQYEINMLQRKKHKKELKKKLQKHKTNFLLNKKEKVKGEIENDEFEKLNSDWKNFLAIKIAEKFPHNSLNTKLLTKILKDYINNILNLKENKIVDNNNENIDKIIGFDNETEYYTQESKLENEDNENENEKDDLDSKNKILLEERKLNEKKELYNKLSKNEKIFEDNNKEAAEFVDKLKLFHNYFDIKDYNNIKNTKLKDIKEENLDKELPEQAHDEIRDRVVNYTLKLFDKFSLYNTLKFWMEKRKDIEKVLKEHPDWNSRNKKEINNEFKEKSAKNNTINVKYIYTEPSDEIKKIIPFASKKYTIQKKD